MGGVPPSKLPQLVCGVATAESIAAAGKPGEQPEEASSGAILLKALTLTLTLTGGE